MDATPDFDAAAEVDIAMLNAIREHRRTLAYRHAAMRRPPIWLVGVAGALSGIALTAIVIYLAHITPPIFH
jgi:hypothetical protein